MWLRKWSDKCDRLALDQASPPPSARSTEKCLTKCKALLCAKGRDQEKASGKCLRVKSTANGIGTRAEETKPMMHLGQNTALYHVKA
ncbi:unnamed protein product [Arctogadus glacialis]